MSAGEARSNRIASQVAPIDCHLSTYTIIPIIPIIVTIDIIVIMDIIVIIAIIVIIYITIIMLGIFYELSLVTLPPLSANSLI